MTVYSGLYTSQPPKWAPVNGARGARRDVRKKLRLVVVHTWESPEDGVERYLRQLRTPATPATGRAFQSKDRNGNPVWETPDGKQTIDASQAKIRADGTPTPWTYGSGYMAIADGTTGQYHLTADPAIFKAFSQPPVNDEAISICCPGRARQSRAEWLDTYSRRELDAIAALIADAADRYGIAPVRLSPAELKAGKSGYCGHRDITAAYGPAGGHTDPGPNFPWDVLAERIDIATGVADMAQIVQVYDDKTWQPVTGDMWLLDGGSIEAATPSRALALIGMKAARLNSDGKAGGVFRSQLTNLRLVGTCPAGYQPSWFLAA